MITCDREAGVSRHHRSSIKLPLLPPLLLKGLKQHSIMIFHKNKAAINPHCSQLLPPLPEWVHNEVIFPITSLQTQIQVVPVLSSLYPYLISFSSFTFLGTPYRIFPLFLLCLACHFYFVVIEQQQQLCPRVEVEVETLVYSTK